jgi:hypothetical protein
LPLAERAEIAGKEAVEEVIERYVRKELMFLGVFLNPTVV